MPLGQPLCYLGLKRPFLYRENLISQKRGGEVPLIPPARVFPEAFTYSGETIAIALECEFFCDVQAADKRLSQAMPYT